MVIDKRTKLEIISRYIIINTLYVICLKIYYHIDFIPVDKWLYFNLYLNIFSERVIKYYA